MDVIVQTPEFPVQEQDLIYALDIGTRSVIGMLGRMEGGRVHILAVEKQPHRQRAMLDGQIEDIDQVAKTVVEITERLEQDVQRKLTHVCVAAAGRSLRTECGCGVVELEIPETVTDEQIQRLTAEAVSDAEQKLKGTESADQRMFLVGYTVMQFRLDHYPMAKLLGHTGKVLEADVVATFLPSEVVDSLNMAVQKAGLETASLTLEPIAALNAAIPSELRLLNLVLVDIGAGTSDIAACRDGSVVGYTMATVAGDEISEALMREYLIDYNTAERVKTELAGQETISFQDIVGFEQSYSAEEILSRIEPAIKTLVEEISQRVQQLNGGPPSALFLAGGGSKLAGLCEKMADAMKMDRRRVALAGAHFKINSYADEIDLQDPEYATPLGIAVSSCMGLIHDSYRVFLNGAPAKLFRSGQMTAMEILMMNGYGYESLLGRSGKSLSLYIDGKRTVYPGSPAVPAQLKINGVQAQPSMLIYAGDKIEFSPAVNGEDRKMTAAELMETLSVSGLTSHGIPLRPEDWLQSGDRLKTMSEPSKPPEPKQDSIPVQDIPPVRYKIRMNGKDIILPQKKDGAPYYLMDLLEFSGLDFEHLEHPVRLKVNGRDGLFQQVIKEGDQVEISYEVPPEGI